MPLRYPDIFEPNNPNVAQLDSIHLRGGRRFVANLTELYALVNKSDQLAVNVTIVRVLNDGIGEREYLLKDANNISNANGWILYNSNAGTFVRTIEFLVGGAEMAANTNSYSNADIVGKKVIVKLDGTSIPLFPCTDRQWANVDIINGVITWKDTLPEGQLLQIDIYN